MTPHDFIPSPVIDGQTAFVSTSVTFGTKTEILRVKLRSGKIPWLVGYMVNTSGAASDATWYLEQGQAPVGEYGISTVSFGDPSLGPLLPYPKQLIESSDLVLSARLASANAVLTARAVIFYTERK